MKLKKLKGVLLAEGETATQLELGTILFEAKDGKATRAVFLCPCGCGDTVRLDLVYRRSETFKGSSAWAFNDRPEAPTFTPAVYRTSCKSHFRVMSGVVMWC